MVRGLRGSSRGFTILELLFAIAMAGTLTTIAVPQGLRALDAFRTRAAARYLAARLGDARLGAIKRSLTLGLRFEAASPDYRIASVADGNGNGLRTTEIQRGTDRTLTQPELLAWHFPDVVFEILDGVPDADGQPANDSDGVRVGVSKLLHEPGRHLLLGNALCPRPGAFAIRRPRARRHGARARPRV
jgi:prepilin-type N-terminal cleavage/methylation domain-containing protein